MDSLFEIITSPQSSSATRQCAPIASPGSTLKLHGTVLAIVFSKDDFVVADFQAEEAGDEPIRLVGAMPGLAAGMDLFVLGQWVENSTYGPQLKVREFAMEIPRTKEGLIRYLGSGLVKGIGPALAERIVARFGKEALQVLDETPGQLLAVSGIGPKKLEGIKVSWEEQRKISRLMTLLIELGVGPGLAAKIRKAFGDEAERIVRTQPYRLTEIHGIGFKTADQLAQNLGIGLEDPARLEAGVRYTLEQMMSNEGHTCAPRLVLAGRACEILEVEADLIQAAISRLLETKRLRSEEGVVIEEDSGPTEAIYLNWLHQAEMGVTERLRRLTTEPPTLNIDLPELPKQIAGITLSERQREAVKFALTRKVVIITGGPGTGKTTVTRSILALLKEAEIKPTLAAPTGRAAKRMAEVCGHEASTIHRLLRATGTNRFDFDEHNLLDTQILIIDEFSMVDVGLFHALLKALPNRTHLVIVGDADQLPSVGPGRLMFDLVESGVLPCVRLDTIFRQAESSSIITNAHRINRGETPLFPQDVAGDGRKDFFFFSAEDPLKANELVVDLVARRIPARFGHQPADIQVLSPLRRKGEAAVDALNRTLQEALNPPGSQPGHRSGGRIFRPGDRVIQTRNNYDTHVFNGEMGAIEAIDAEERRIIVRFEEDRLVEYSFDADLEDLELAYALSIHKSQGSEYRVVVVPMLTAHYIMLRRNLIYTAVTRAREMVVLVGQRKAIALAVSEGRRERRYSGLRHYLASG